MLKRGASLNDEAMPPLGAPGGEHLASGPGAHSLAEAVDPVFLPIVRLERHFHCAILL